MAAGKRERNFLNGLSLSRSFLEEGWFLKNRTSSVVGGGWWAVGIGMRAASQPEVQAAPESQLLLCTNEQLSAMLMSPGCLPECAEPAQG